MKPAFTITSIKVVGHPDRRDSEVSLKPGLNVICGPSNSGKSWVLHCIDYMFGAEAKDFSLKEADGYTRVVMTVKTDVGQITLSRPIGAGHNDVEVHSNDQRIQSGIYKCGKASANTLPISHVWLKLIGFESPESVRVIKNKNYLGQSLTWRTFSHILFADETSISKNESILFPVQNTGVTAFKSALATLLTGRDFSAEESDESPEEKKRANNAVIAYLETQPDAIVSRLKLIDSALVANRSNTLEEEFDELGNDVAQVQDSLRNATSQGQRIIADLGTVREHIAESKMLERRYEELASSYQARLQRLDFVVEGRELTDRHPLPMICPVCDQVLPADAQSRIAHPGKEEQELLKAKLNDLLEVIHEVKTSIHQDSLMEQNLASKSDDINKLIKSALLPRLDGLKRKLDEHNALVAMRAEREQLENELETVRNEIERRKAMPFPKEQFDPLDYYPDSFWDDISTLLLDTLGACAFPNLKEAYLNRKSFDAVVNDKFKRREGKGYRSFVNTVVLLVLHDYLASDHAAHNPSILMIDTPLLGLDDPQEDPELQEMRETIPAALYDYLADADMDGQLIIADNIKFMPDISELKDRCNIIRFTKQSNEGRYGFLLDVTDSDFMDKDEKETNTTDGSGEEQNA
ncbi:ATP-binding protein [Bifidobacterium scaligerum]|uniref:Rad50/SbcC-type AAA domain-containing protein n=1 Tax=Bifidobacterium scaligerum TaxID=2052656 RepID=A0A2M9HSW3_9BIFI|nr:ATP-binding protein [Bifidobacterium scaligerum]PJM79900.1 hypothetical protein CUU80_01825 [Bifidobacterium scaligerum]